MMTPIEGVDYAWERPSPAGLYAAGKRFACRYLSYNTTGKNLTAPERDALWAAGLAIVLNWENRADDVRSGFDGGVANAAHALELANALGAPPSVPIYFSVDQDTRSNPAMIDTYFKGVARVLPLSRIGVYGGLSTVQRALDQKLVAWWWQASAWSGGAWMKAAHLQQYRNGVTVGGADCDLNRAMVADYGQWTGDDMALSDADASALTHRVEAIVTLADPNPVGAGLKPESNELVKLLKRVDANVAALAARVPADLTLQLSNILQAAVDDPATTVTMTVPEQQALADALAAAIHVPSAAEVATAVLDEEHARLES